MRTSQETGHDVKPIGPWVWFLAGWSLILLFLVFYFYGPVIGSNFGLVDDHEILRFELESVNSNPAVNFWNLLSTTEVAKWGELPRFRPWYYMLRIIETLNFNGDAHLWYFVRVILVWLTATLTLFFVFVVGGRTIREASWKSPILWLLGLPAIWVVVLPAWRDIALRLGPSEIYLTPVLVLFFLCGALVFTQKHAKWPWFMLAFVTCFAVGLKENALILTVLFTFMVLLSAEKKNRRLLLVLLTVVLITSVLITAGPTLAFLHGGDVYGQSRSASIWLSMIGQSKYVSTALLLTVMMFLLERFKKPNPEAFPATRPLFSLASIRGKVAIFPFSAAGAAGVTILLSELFFYQNSYDQGRYGIVNQVVLVFVAALSTALIFQIGSVQKWNSLIAWILVPIIYFASGFWSNSYRTIPTIRETSKRVSIATNQMVDDFTAAVKESRSHPASPMLVFVNRTFDYEPALSAGVFLRFLGVQSDPILKLNLKDSERGGVLFDGLAEVNKNGSQTYFFRPDDSSAVQGNSICVLVSEMPAGVPSACAKPMTIRWSMPLDN